jgi:hypothetical protein
MLLVTNFPSGQLHTNNKLPTSALADSFDSKWLQQTCRSNRGVRGGRSCSLEEQSEDWGLGGPLTDTPEKTCHRCRPESAAAAAPASG